MQDRGIAWLRLVATCDIAVTNGFRKSKDVISRFEVVYMRSGGNYRGQLRFYTDVAVYLRVTAVNIKHRGSEWFTLNFFSVGMLQLHVQSFVFSFVVM